MASNVQWKWDTNGVGKALATSPEILKRVQKITDAAVDDLKKDILSNRTSTSPNRKIKAISLSSAYFAANVRGQVIRSSRRQKGIPIGVIALRADNALAYEATHANVLRTMVKYRA